MPRLPVTVRDATPADVEAIASVARASWTETYRDIFEPDFIERFLAEAYAPEALSRSVARAASDDDVEFLVAERDGRLVGYLNFGIGPRGPQLFRVYAHPDAYGTGVGSTLLDELHRRIAGRVERYVLDVHSRNARGRAFYDRHGFEIVGGGETPDCDLTLAISLTPPGSAAS